MKEVRRGSGYGGLMMAAVMIIAALPAARGISVASAPQQPKLPWPRASTLGHHQSLPSVLASIEERLRSLENLKYTTDKWDMFVETLSRKLESLDVRTRAVQMKLDHLETVSQTLTSYEMKNELLTDQLQRKFQTNQDRLVHRISFTENRLDASIAKMQGSVEMELEKLEKIHESMENKLETIGSTINEVKNRVTKLEEGSNATNRAIEHFIENSVAESNSVNINKISQIIEGFEKQVNRSIMLSDQNYGPSVSSNPNDWQGLKTDVISEANKIGNKISNMYNDLWRRIVSIEGIMKDVQATSNLTKLLAREDFQSSIEDQRCSDTIESLMDITVGGLSDSLQRKIGDMSHKIDTNFHAANSMVMGACHSLHQDRVQLEAKLTLVLEKILETIVNGSLKTEKQQVEVLEFLKSHNNQVVRTVAYNTNLVKRLADDTSLEHKNIDNTILEVAILINQMLSYKHDSSDFQENQNEPDPLPAQKLNRSDEDEFNTSDHFTDRTEEGSSSFEEPFPTNLNAIVANFSEGVLNILTELPNENSTETKISEEIPSIDHKKKNHNEDPLFISLGLLNKTLNTKNLSVIIGEPKVDNFTAESGKSFKNATLKATESAVNRTEGPKDLEERLIEEKVDNQVGKLLMLYLKALKGHLTKEKFLHEANPQKPYESMDDLIKELKQNKNFPSDFLKELEDWNKETREKTIEDLFDNKENDNNNEDYYIDSYDGM